MDTPHASAARIALDIGSTVVKVAWLDRTGQLENQLFFPRDFDAGIGGQVRRLLAELNIDAENNAVLACSSANGGLRVGIVCLSKSYSGTTMRNQVLLAGANPVFVHELHEAPGDGRQVDLLLVGGGIDCEHAGPLAAHLTHFDASRYRYGTLVYAGNRHLADSFRVRFPDVRVIANPQSETLSGRLGSVFETVRRAYLDDLVFKEGISELPASIAHRIRPTPEVTSQGFLRSTLGQSNLAIVGACVALDIGGATTDLHYTVEIVAEDSPVQPAGGISVARYVFSDLGVFASKDTLLMQLRAHPRLYEFLCAVEGDCGYEMYVGIRDGEIDVPAALLAYSCLFLAFDRFAAGKGPGLPVGRLDSVAQVILTGGAAQMIDVNTVGRILRLLLSPTVQAPLIQIDERYEIWVAGITWKENLS